MLPFVGKISRSRTGQVPIRIIDRRTVARRHRIRGRPRQDPALGRMARTRVGHNGKQGSGVGVSTGPGGGVAVGVGPGGVAVAVGVARGGRVAVAVGVAVAVAVPVAVAVAVAVAVEAGVGVGGGPPFSLMPVYWMS
jgi:hypothetical protein